MSSADAATPTEHELSLLTPEEREALRGDDPTPEELASLSRLAEGAVVEDAGDDGGNPDEVLDEHGRPIETVVPPAAKEPEAAAAPEPEAQPTQRQATYRAELPEDFQTKMDAVTQKIDGAWSEFDAGNIERAELQRRLREAEGEKAALDRIAVKAEISSEMAEQNQKSAWQTAIEDLFKTAATTGVDYAKDDGKRNDLDTFVKALANNEANADKPMEWFLSEADKRVRALHGIGDVKPAATTDKPAAPAGRKPPLALVPKTLAHVPGGEGPGDVSDEFQNLDALEGEAFEAALSKMRPEQQERYLASR